RSPRRLGFLVPPRVAGPVSRGRDGARADAEPVRPEPVEPLGAPADRGLPRQRGRTSWPHALALRGAGSWLDPVLITPTLRHMDAAGVGRGGGGGPRGALGPAAPPGARG